MTNPVPTKQNFKGETVLINCQAGYDSYSACSRKAKLEFGGKWYCTQHFKKAVERAGHDHNHRVLNSVESTLRDLKQKDEALLELAAERTKHLLDTDPQLRDYRSRRDQLRKRTSAVVYKAFEDVPVPDDLLAARKFLVGAMKAIEHLDRVVGSQGAESV